jgi:hypothetical protein
MVAETNNIQKMAEIVADELFSEFLWEKIGPTNTNWACEDKTHHRVETHPSDVVFYYDEPYSQKRTYIHCDLKSYAKGSIKAASVQGAIESLAKQVACAEKSDEWRNLYMIDGVNADVCGLLFVYNHDGGYDKDFSQHLNGIKVENLDIPKDSKLVILGPRDIHWLNNVRFEIRMMRGKSGPGKLPERDSCRYFYPQPVRHANLQMEKARAATLEMLTSPWIVLEYDLSVNEEKRGIVVFHKRRGETQDEFIYLLDYLRHFGLLESKTDIQIKTLDTVPEAASIFQKATLRYIEGLGRDATSTKLADCIREIKYEKMTQVVSSFSSIDLGMDYV